MVDNNHRSARREEEAPGASAAFPYDRMTIERFREAFPRARWSDERKSWFVPGKTAARRIERWLAQEAERLDVHGDLKGRDAYAFDPITSPYLEIGEDLRVRTPYSKRVIEELRAVPFAHWDEELRVWHVPFRSYEELRRRWNKIEEAARRSEPEERRRRREAEKNSEAQKAARARSAERRRHRYPLLAETLPPIDRPVSTERYGIVVFIDISGEVAESSALEAFYPHTIHGLDYVWGSWRPATLSELVATWPARREPNPLERSRGWWQPTLPELRVARRSAVAGASQKKAQRVQLRDDGPRNPEMIAAA
ncbi:hypothetical protein PYH37_000823 [Sinorhizobium numidicum]|uniref:HARP domain-containing protein n=1 Tax=Sinorhizobium numidicum TaxID=680248 RepID=A0ABY8CRX9_9HYPH|nr:hypothetical protein [Sinorhizobium numidicum]WEX75412.1 hypothetical protein PYH37_000823 [Sinorhizobium numidicum]WEX81408.1 hypothetical protein PYH38_000824 [Sinorhizobium numidicum]